MLDSFRSRIAAARKSNELFFAALIPVERIVSIFGKDKKVSGTVSEVLASFSHFVDEFLAVVRQPLGFLAQRHEDAELRAFASPRLPDSALSFESINQ